VVIEPLDRLEALTVGGLLAGATSLVPIQSGGASERAAHSSTSSSLSKPMDCFGVLRPRRDSGTTRNVKTYRHLLSRSGLSPNLGILCDL